MIRSSCCCCCDFSCYVFLLLATTAQIVGYKSGMLSGGGVLVFFVNVLGWPGILLVMAKIVLLALLAVVLFNEEASYKSKESSSSSSRRDGGGGIESGLQGDGSGAAEAAAARGRPSAQHICKRVFVSCYRVFFSPLNFPRAAAAAAAAVPLRDHPTGLGPAHDAARLSVGRAIRGAVQERRVAGRLDVCAVPRRRGREHGADRALDGRPGNGRVDYRQEKERKE